MSFIHDLIRSLACTPGGNPDGSFAEGEFERLFLAMLTAGAKEEMLAIRDPVKMATIALRTNKYSYCGFMSSVTERRATGDINNKFAFYSVPRTCGCSVRPKQKGEVCAECTHVHKGKSQLD